MNLFAVLPSNVGRIARREKACSLYKYLLGEPSHTAEQVLHGESRHGVLVPPYGWALPEDIYRDCKPFPALQCGPHCSEGRQTNSFPLGASKMESNKLKHLYVEELKDLYSAESQLVKALRKMAKAAT